MTLSKYEQRVLDATTALLKDQRRAAPDEPGVRLREIAKRSELLPGQAAYQLRKLIEGGHLLRIDARQGNEAFAYSLPKKAVRAKVAK